MAHTGDKPPSGHNESTDTKSAFEFESGEPERGVVV